MIDYTDEELDNFLKELSVIETDINAIEADVTEAPPPVTTPTASMAPLPVKEEVSINEPQFHSTLKGLDYVDSGHTGFQKAGNYIEKENDPNFELWKASEYKAPIEFHSELKNLEYKSSGHTGFQPAGNYLTTENDPVFKKWLATEYPKNWQSATAWFVGVSRRALNIATADALYLRLDGTNTATSVTTGTLKVTGGATTGYLLTSDVDGNATWQIAPSGGTMDHGALSGLADDDHTQYLLVDGSRDLNGDLTVTGSGMVHGDLRVTGDIYAEDIHYVNDITTSGNIIANGNLTVTGTGSFGDVVTGVDPVLSTHLTTKSYVDSLVAASGAILDHGSLNGLTDDDHTQYHNDARALTWIGTRSTSDLPEGTNQYYTDEKVDDRLSNVLIPGSGLSTNYNDVANTLTINSEVTKDYVDTQIGTVNELNEMVDVQFTGPMAGDLIQYDGVSAKWLDKSVSELTDFIDEDTMATNSATKVPSQQSVKAYVDNSIAASGAIHEDHGSLLGLSDNDHPQYALTTYVDNIVAASGAIPQDHGLLYGLTHDDHPQYSRTDGTRAITGDQHFEQDITVAGSGVFQGDVRCDHVIGDGSLLTNISIGSVSHSSLANLDADDHTQYMLVDGSRAFTAAVSGVVPTLPDHLTTKDYVDDLVAASGAIHEDHGTLLGLGDDDHTIYTKANGTRAFTGAQSFADGSEGAPSINFSSEPNDGFYRSGDFFYATVQGVKQVLFNDKGISAVEGTTTNPGYSFISTSSAGMSANSSTGKLSLSTQNTERLAIAYDGDVTIHQDLNVSGSGIFTGDVRANNVIGNGSMLTAIDHTNLTNLNSTTYTHLTSANHTDLTDSGATTLHKHDHGNMDGLSDDDHTGYVLANGTRNITGDQTFEQDVFVTGSGVFNEDIRVNDLTIGYGNGGTSSNVAIGISALATSSAGATKNTAIGYEAGKSITTGDNNTLIGYQAGTAITTAYNNVAIGETALHDVTTGIYNIAIGSQALEKVTTTSSNIAIGQTVLIACTGSNNIALGSSSCVNVTTSDQNVGVGGAALYNITTGHNNVAVGTNAGYNAGTAMQTNDHSVFIGDGANASANALTNTIVIGDTAQGTKSNQVVLGNSSVTETILRGTIYSGTRLINEVVSSAQTTNTLFAVSTQWKDLTSISLTAGSWLVSCMLANNFVSPVGCTDIGVGISTYSGNDATSLSQGDNLMYRYDAAGIVSKIPITIPNYLMTLAATTTVYLKFQATYTSGTLYAIGRITALRVA